MQVRALQPTVPLIPLGVALPLNRTTWAETTLDKHYSGSHVRHLGKAFVLEGRSGVRRDLSCHSNRPYAERSSQQCVRQTKWRFVRSLIFIKC